MDFLITLIQLVLIGVFCFLIVKWGKEIIIKIIRKIKARKLKKQHQKEENQNEEVK